MGKRITSRVIRGLVSMSTMATDSISWHRFHGTPKKEYADLVAARDYANDLIRRYNARVVKRGNR